MSQEKANISIRRFFESQLLSTHMDVYEKDLKIAYSNRAPNFEELLKKDDTVTIGQQNLRKLAIKMYKSISNDFSPIFMKDSNTYSIQY